MKVPLKLFLSLFVFFSPLIVLGNKTGLPQRFGFITRSGDKLMDGNKEFRFIGLNIPNLQVNEDNSFLSKGWHRIDGFEMRDAFKTIQMMGGTVTRVYVFSIQGGVNNPNLKSHIYGPGKYDEEMFRDFDLLLKLANDYKIRLIVPFIDNWDWWGGTMRLAAFRGKKQAEFCTDSSVRADYKALVNYILNRKNTYTGVKYKDDPAILAWETGNELGIENAHNDAAILDRWTKEMSAYIKSIDKKHLLVDGKDSYRFGLSEAQVDDPNTDILTEHYYWGDYVASCKKARNLCKSKKVFFVGEFNSADINVHEKLFDEVISNGTAGALVWSLRFHTKDGGFYYHSERSDAANPCYRWPGFSSAMTNEANKMAQIREFSYKIRGLAVPKLPIPEAPVPIKKSTTEQLRWLGSVGAESYIIERATNPKGKWAIIDAKVMEDGIPYVPYSDITARKGQSYYYRLRAQNKSGISSASKVLGPLSR